MIYFAIYLLGLWSGLFLGYLLFFEEDVPPKPNSEVMMLGDVHWGSKKFNKKEVDRFLREVTNHDSFLKEEESQHLGCYYKDGKLKKL